MKKTAIALALILQACTGGTSQDQLVEAMWACQPYGGVSKVHSDNRGESVYITAYCTTATIEIGRKRTQTEYEPKFLIEPSKAAPSAEPKRQGAQPL